MKCENNKIVYEVEDWIKAKNDASGWGAFPEQVDGKILKIKKIVGDKVEFEADGQGQRRIRICDIERPASQPEIDKAIKEQPIMIGEYEVQYWRDSIKVGCQSVTKEKFLEIGRKANWL